MRKWKRKTVIWAIAALFLTAATLPMKQKDNAANPLSFKPSNADARERFINSVEKIRLLPLKKPKQTKEIKRLVIAIDPGHGEWDSGAKARGGKILEANINWSYAMTVEDKLKKAGYNALITREESKTCQVKPIQKIELQCRVDAAKTAGAAIYISIHANWNQLTSPKGLEVYYNDAKYHDGQTNPFPGESKRLAETLFNALPRDNLPNEGVKKEFFYVNRAALMPSVLVEIGYLSNQDDLKKIMDDSFKDLFASKFVEAVSQYIKQAEKKPAL